MPTRDTHGRSIDDADELAFTLPDGTSIGKRDDLDSHRTGATRFERLTERSRSTIEHDEGATTVTAVDAVIHWNGDRIEASLTYTRSWRIIDGRWQVVSGSAAAS